jgi:hypothetical protein
MARAKVFDYDAASDETIVTAGVEGVAAKWIGFDLDKQIVHIVYEEGVLAADGKSIETATRKGQISIEGQDTVDFYTANKTAFDDLINACLAKAASELSKTGELVY